MKRRNFNPHHCKFEEKKLALETYFSDQYHGSKMSQKRFCEICDINYHAFCRWVRTIGGDISRIDELRRKPRGKSSGSLSGLSEPIRELILLVKKLNATWGPLKIKQYLFRHEQVLIPQTSIYRFLKSQGLVKERVAPVDGPKHDRSFEYPYPMAAVQMDLMHLRLASGLTIFLVTMLDDFSRFVLAAKFVPVKTMDAVTKIFSDVVKQYGVMEHLLTDHGSEFVSWQRFTRFEELLSNLEIEHIASGPNKKENQGKVERWHQTVREALRERGPLDYSSEAQLWIRQLADHYNYERPHQALSGLVPADRFFGVHEELSAELEQYRAGKREGQKLYFACRIGERKIVVSGPRADALSILLDGVRICSEKDVLIENQAPTANQCVSQLDQTAASGACGTTKGEGADAAARQKSQLEKKQ